MSTWSLVGDEPPATPLAAATRDRAEAQRLRAALEQREQATRGARQDVAAAEARVGTERRDVDRLESASWTRLWVALAGNRAEELERERGDVREAEYALAVATERLRATEVERGAVQARLEGLGDVEAAYQRALGEHEQRLRRSGSGAGRRLGGIEEELGRLRSWHDELDEAGRAGMAARDALAKAHDLLGSAEGWATWDTYGGGGLFSDLMKRDRLDQARTVLEQADGALRRFHRELADVSRDGRLQIDASLQRSFGDVWFDNFFSDHRVLNEVRRAASQVGDLAARVGALLTELEAERRQLVGDRGRLLAEREALILAASPEEPA